MATSFTTGHLVAFGDNRMQFVAAPGAPLPDPASIPAHDVPVALGVAASSAFPPLFPPVRVDHTTFGSDQSLFPNRHYLSDGGVFDNLGIRGLLWLFDGHEALDTIVVSDAQRGLALEYGYEYNLTVGRTTRCVDLMMNRVSWFESAGALGQAVYALDVNGHYTDQEYHDLNEASVTMARLLYSGVRTYGERSCVDWDLSPDWANFGWARLNNWA